MANNLNYTIKLDTTLDETGIRKALQNYNRAGNRFVVKLDVQISQKGLNQIEQLNTLLSKTEALNNYTNSLKNIQETMKSYEQIASKTVTSTNNLAKAVEGSNKEMKSLGQASSDVFRKFNQWAIVSKTWSLLWTELKHLVGTIKELDISFTELSKVTDLTIDDFGTITEKAYNLGAEVAKTTTEVIDAMTEFAKAGYSVEESSSILAKNALVWTNIADGTVSAAEAANMLISVMKAFNIEADNTTYIIDALNEVSNNYAISSGQLSESLTKSASVLAASGTEFSEQLGLITAGTEVIRNANKVSTGLKTISLRLQGMEEDGEAVDGLSAKLADDFEKIGVSLSDVNGQMKSTYEIFESIAKVWPNLNTSQKQYYAELASGKTQANVFIAILDNFNTALKANETALNSAGSAFKENEKFLNSLAGHLQNLKSEWESLVNSKSFQDFAKMLIDMATSAIKLLKSIGGLNTALVALGALALFKARGPIWNFAQDLILTAMGAKELGGGFRSLSISAELLGTSMSLLYVKIAAIAAVVALVVKAIDELVITYKEQAEIVEDLSNELSDTEAQLHNVEQQLQENYDLIKEINREPLDIINQNTLDTLKKENAELEIQKQALEDIAEARREELSIETTKLLGKTHEEASPVLSYYSGMSARASGIQYQGSDTTVAAIQSAQNINIRAGYEYIGQIEEATKRLKELEAGQKNTNFTAEYYQNVLAESNAHLTALIENLISYKDSLSDGTEASKALKEEINGLEVAYISLNAQGKTYQDILAEMTNAQKEQLTELQQTGKLTAETFVDAFPTLAIMFEAIGIPLEEVINRLTVLKNIAEDTPDSFDTLEDSVNNTINGYKYLVKVIDEYNSTNTFSAETLRTLQKEFPGYLDLLLQYNEDLDQITSSLKEGIVAELQAQTVRIQADYDKTIDALERERIALTFNTDAWTANKDQILQNIAATAAAEQNYKERMDSISAFWKKINETLVTAPKSTTTKATDTWKAEFTKFYNDLKNRRDRDLIDTRGYIDELTLLNEKYFANSTKYAEEYSKYLLEIWKEQQNLFKEILQDYEHEASILVYQGADKATIIAKYREIQEELHRQAEHYRELGLAENNDLIQDLSEQWWKYQQKIEDLQEDIKDSIQDKFEKIRDAMVDEIEAQIKEQKDLLDAQNDAIDTRIDGLKAELDSLEDESDVEEKLLKIEEARKKLAEAKQQKVRVYREGRGFVYETDFDAVASAQGELDNLLKEWDLFQEKSRIQTIIDNLEKEKDANKKRVDETIEDLNRLKDAWDKSLDLDSDLGEYGSYLDELKDMENKSFKERLKMVQDFVDAYQKEMAAMQEPIEQPLQTTSSRSSRTDSSGHSYYDPNTDYQAIINEAEARGDITTAARAEAARNLKIAGEGLDYEQTHKYTDPKTNMPVGLASGTTNADGQVHWVGENGPELYIPPEGSGIMPHNVSENLMAWGTTDPKSLVSKVSNAINNSTVNISNITLPNVKDGNSFLEEIRNFKGYAVQYESARR